MNKIWTIIVAVLFAALAVQADLVTIGATKDTTLRNHVNANEADLGGAETLMVTGARAIFEFDLSGLTGPISGATLTLAKQGNLTGTWAYQILPMNYTANNYSWIEGVGTVVTASDVTAPADASGAASYLNRFNGVTDLAWEDSSGTGVADAAAAGLWGSAIGSASGGTNTWVHLSDTAFTLDASMLETFRTNGVGKITLAAVDNGSSLSGVAYFRSRESVAAYQPSLELNVIPEPATLGMLGLGGLLVLIFRRMRK